MDVPLEDLEYKNSRYYFHERVFSGQAYAMFDSQTSISFRAKFENGIPSGSWQSFGYQGEVIQYGTYSPKTLQDFEIEIDKSPVKIERISLIEFHEGNYSILYVVLINTVFKETFTIDDLNTQAKIKSQISGDVQFNKYNEIIYQMKEKEIG